MSKLNEAIQFVENKYNRQCAFASMTGSRAIGLSNEYSDFDCIVFVIPTWEDYYTGNMLSKQLKVDTLNMDVAVKDIRLFVQLLEKQNPYILNTFFADDVVYHPDFEWMWDYKDMWLSYDPKKCATACIGTAFNKIKKYNNQCEELSDKEIAKLKSACYLSIASAKEVMQSHTFQYNPVVMSNTLRIKNGEDPYKDFNTLEEECRELMFIATNSFMTVSEENKKYAEEFEERMKNTLLRDMVLKVVYSSEV